VSRASLFGRLDERRLRWLLIAFFFALAVPSAVLIVQAFSQLKWEAFRNAQLLSEDVATRIDGELRAAVMTEETRSFGDYSFLVVEGDAAANFVQRSPLSNFPVESSFPGIVGYFQVDPSGALTTPLLPSDGVDPSEYGVAPEEADARRALAAEIRKVLAENQLVQRPASEEAVAQASPSPPAGKLEPLRFGVSRAPSESDERGGKDGNAAAAASSVPPGDVDGNAPVASPAPRAAAPSTPAASSQQLVAAEPTVPPAGAAASRGTQDAFDRLASPALVDRAAAPAAFALQTPEAAQTAATAPELSKDVAAEAQREAEAPQRQKRKEQGAVPELQQERAAGSAKVELRVRTFESELDPLELGRLDTGHLVVFRNAWRDGRRYIQGALIDTDRFVAQAIGRDYLASSLARTTDLAVTYRGKRLGRVGATGDDVYSSASKELAGALLHRTRLSPPFGDVELAFDVRQLPRGTGAALLAWVTLILAAVLCGGFLLIYRFALGQIRLTKQQQDFVSAVSHELKTPLTSIRMYGEMLKAGWADDEKKKIYYEYIHSESERLSRLIENVLQLARLTRSSQRFDRRRFTVAEMMDLVKSKVATQVERAGFVLSLANEAPPETELVVDADCFSQIVINLVDNALKFSAGAQRKIVEIACRLESDGMLLFTVRDYGPGVPKNQMKKIFELFYRPANELTRETVGTGIGLALVHQLAIAMGGRVDVRNREPGAEFRVSIPSA
jgi:signal transduction histidine kinase